MKILAIAGSPRFKGNTNYLVEQALAAAVKLGAETEKIILSRHEVKPCLGHINCATFDSCRQRDDTGWIVDKFYQADGVILATPVYYYNVTAQMKAFIDRTYFLYKRQQRSKARAVGIIVVAEESGIEETVHTLKQFVGEGFNVEEDKIFVVFGYALLPGEVKDNLPLVEAARKLGQQMVESVKEA